MSRLFIVIGYADSAPSAKPFSVYVGSSGEEKRAAMAASPARRFLVLDNPLGYRKNNPGAEANAAAAEAEPDLVATIEHLTGQKEQLQQLLGLAEDSYAAVNKQLTDLSVRFEDLQRAFNALKDAAPVAEPAAPGPAPVPAAEVATEPAPAVPSVEPPASSSAAPGSLKAKRR